MGSAYHFTQMGMANTKKKPAEPDVQWQLLSDFAKNNGEITWRDSAAHRKLEKRKQLLAKRLKAFFGVEDEPFETLPKGLGWRARFTITRNQTLTKIRPHVAKKVSAPGIEQNSGQIRRIVRTPRSS